jgi:hypothetical protein
MRNKYSYIFGGHAIAAEIHKPETEFGILGASALPVTGGRGKAEVGPQTWDIPGVSSVNSFESGSSFVSGQFVTQETGVLVQTVTAAYLNKVELLNGRVKIEALSANLVAEVDDDDEPRFAFGATNPITKRAEQKVPITGLVVDGVSVRVEVDREALELSFEELREKFKPLIPKPIVKLSFEGSKLRDDVSIKDDNIIKIANIRIHFGELLFGKTYRNLTLFRIESGDGKSRDGGPGVASGPQGYSP